MSISFYSHQHLIGPVLRVGKTFLSLLHCLSSLVRDQSAVLYGFLFLQVTALNHLGADDSQFIHGAWTSPLERNMPTASVMSPLRCLVDRHKLTQLHHLLPVSSASLSDSSAFRAVHKSPSPSSLKSLSNLARNVDPSLEQTRNLAASHQEFNCFSPGT